MIQIAGPNGCGKTTFYKKFLLPVLESLEARLEYINADDIALDFRSEDGAGLGLDANIALHARDEADFRRDLLLKEGHKASFIFETVFSDSGGHRLNYMRRAKAAGYKVVMIFIAVSNVELAAQRVKIRASQGGHDVPIEKQLSRFPNSLANGRSAIEIADLSLFMDNSSTNPNMQISHTDVAVFLNGDLLASSRNTPDWFDQCWSPGKLTNPGSWASAGF